MACPICKKGKLVVVDDSPHMKTLVCSQCPKTLLVKTTCGKTKEVSEVIVPGMLMVNGTIKILEFFGITTMYDLINHLDNLTIFS